MTDYAKALKKGLAYPCMFFAGLILLIPHRIGMSRVNYVIKRYNLPISRAGLLLYKYHNNIELSLLIGTLPGNIFNWSIDAITKKLLEKIFHGDSKKSDIMDGWNGGDFGHLNAFYFSLIFLTLFDGFANAFAFALNGKYSSMLSAGIPLSGFLVTFLHYIYKFFYDIFLWDDFDYFVLRLQLLCNIIIILIALGLWSVDQIFDIIIVINHIESKKAGSSSNCNDTNNKDFHTALTKGNTSGYIFPAGPCPHKISSPGNIGALFQDFSSGNDDKEDNHADWSPIGMLAISLGTVYAFYPSIAPYSIVDFQYASIIELWILIISAIIPFLFALLDFISDRLDGSTNDFWYGPSGLNTKKATQNSSGTTATIAGAFLNWNPNGGYWFWHLVWLCVIPYILSIQIFMSMLHYPHSLLSCLCNNHPYFIVVTSILFNTLREVLQALGFAGAGKQSREVLKGFATTPDKPLVKSLDNTKIEITLVVLLLILVK